MDLIGQLAGALGVQEEQAQAVAGAVLGTVKKQVADEAGGDAAAKVDAAVPELSGWQAKAQSMLGGGGGGGGGGLLGAAAGALGGGGGGLLGAAAGALGGEDARQTAALVTILGKLDIDPSKAALVAPLALSFLKDRLDPKLLNTVLSAAPMLAGGASGAGSDGGGLGAAAGMLGGLLGKK